MKINKERTILAFQNFSFIYGTNNQDEPAVSNINFKLNEGEVLILAGPSGSGKSTISYAMNGMIPYKIKGFMKGDVKFYGKSVWDLKFMEISRNVGLVKQNPLEQLVTFTVRDEIGFGLENIKTPKEEIIARTEEIAEFMGISHLLDREIDQLSGGQKQLTVLCSFLVMKPKVLILDEPIAFLDQKSESLLLNRLKKLVKAPDYNLSVIIIEHRLSRVMDIADKIVILNDAGRILIQGPINEAFTRQFEQIKKANVRIPWILNTFYDFKEKRKEIDIEPPANFEQFLSLVNDLKFPDLKQLKQSLMDTEIKPKNLEKYENMRPKIQFNELYIKKLDKEGEQKEQQPKPKEDTFENEKVILETKDLSFDYPNANITALKKLNIKIHEGDFIGLVGPNGSGKTTLLYLLANLYEPTSGNVYFKGENIAQQDTYEYARHVGFIFQNPENMIFKPTLREEILYGPSNFGMREEIHEDYLQKLIAMVGDEKESKNPFNLSWGQKRRLNLSSVFIYNPDIILLDEPFIGQDQKTIDAIIETLFIENKRGKTIIISSHDYHLLLKYTKHIIELNKDGTLKDYADNGTFFSRHHNLGPIILLQKINQLLEGGDE